MAPDDQVAAFHPPSRSRYLLLDGLWLSVRASAHAKRRVILAAYGIDAAGNRQLLDYRQAASESTGEWRLLTSPLSSGGSIPRPSRWSPPTVPMGSPRLSPRRSPRPPCSSAGRTASGTCSTALPRAERRPCLRGLAIYRARTRRAAVAAYWRWAMAWRGRHPGLVRSLERDLDELLAVFSVPEPMRVRLRSTNLLERAFRELRRRLRPIGALPDRRSADRILYGQVLRLNELLIARPFTAFPQDS